MKFLLAFALVAVASALPEPVRLLDPVLVQQEAAYAPLDLPQEVSRTVKVVNAVENADGIVEEVNEDVSAFAVNFVDEAVNAEIPAAVASEDVSAFAVNAEAPAAVEAEDVSAFAVNFVDEAVNADAPAAEASEDVSTFAVKFVEEAVNAEAPVAADGEITYSNYVVQHIEEAVNADAPAAEASEDVSTFAVNFVEEAVNAEAPVAADGEITYSNYVVQHIEEAANEETGAPFTVRVVQLPLPDSVVLPLDAMMPSIAPAMVDAPVQMTFDYEGNNVKVADTNEEISPYPKRYPDPRWR